MARAGAAVLEEHAPGEAAGRRPFPYPDSAARHWILSSIVWLTIVDLFGLVLATEFVTPEAFGGISWLQFSRIRPSHVNGVILAWLTMMYFGALFYMLPRLVGTRGMWSERLGIWCAWAWNVMYLLGIIGLLTGHSQGREYGEFIWPIDILLLVIWCLNIVPRVTNTPLYSYTLSLVSFWGMAFFYTGVGDHHILQSPTPAWLKTIAEVSSWMLLVPVFAFTINILGTMKGNWDKFFTNLPLRFTLTAFFFYFLVNIQGAFEALQPFNRLTHFTNFVVAHAHLALLGAFTILGMGIIDYMVAQIWARPLWSRTLTEWMYWLVTIGFTGFFSVLTLAGLQQGLEWEQGVPEVNVLPQLHGYYIARGIFGAMIVLSGIVQIVNIGMTIFTDTTERKRRETRVVAEAIAPTAHA